MIRGLQRELLKQQLDRLHLLQKQQSERGGLYTEWEGGLEMKELNDALQKFKISGQIDPQEFDALSMKYYIKHNLT